MAILIFIISPFVAAQKQAKAEGTFFTLGNADRTYDNYNGYTITCYLGQLFPGQPIYWCMYPDGSMDHSWFVYQSREMNEYYVTGGGTTTFTFTLKK